MTSRAHPLLFSLLAAMAASILDVHAQQSIQPVGGVAPGVLPTLAPAATYNPKRMIEMEPREKRPLLLKEGERNPYAQRTETETIIDENGENPEETQIRRALTSLSVSGQVRGPNGLRLLLGDIILEKDKVLPELLPDQTQNLKVLEVTEDSVVLAWLDIETNEPTGRNMQLSYDLTPSVSYALRGQLNRSEEGAPAQVQMGVLRIGQERKREEAKLTENDPAKKLPREIYEAGQ